MGGVRNEEETDYRGSDSDARLSIYSDARQLSGEFYPKHRFFLG
jgi:hypothetical protein